MASGTSVIDFGSGYRPPSCEELEDSVSGELMARAVTVVPCGHAFNEDTVIQILAGNKLCPLDRQPIEQYVPNFNIRNLAARQSLQGSQPVQTSKDQYSAPIPPTPIFLPLPPPIPPYVNPPGSYEYQRSMKEIDLAQKRYDSFAPGGPRTGLPTWKQWKINRAEARYELNELKEQHKQTEVRYGETCLESWRSYQALQEKRTIEIEACEKAVQRVYEAQLAAYNLQKEAYENSQRV